MRYSELARLPADVGQQMLPQTLRALERDGLLIRTVTPTAPVTVTYELTDRGLSLHHLTRGLRQWAQTHMDQVLANREKHGARASQRGRRSPSLLRAEMYLALSDVRWARIEPLFPDRMLRPGLRPERRAADPHEPPRGSLDVRKARPPGR